MAEPPSESWERQLQELARDFPYPPTPDIAGRVRERLATPRPAPRSRFPLAWAALLLAVLSLGLLATPGVRAGLLEMIQLGAIRIRVLPPTETATPAREGSVPPVQASPRPASTLPVPLLGLAGESTLAEANAAVHMPIHLPTYPPNLGPPDRVFVQALEGEAVILAWMEPEDENKVRLSLHQLSQSFWGEKFIKESIIEETEVHGIRALWLAGGHYLEVHDAQGRVRWEERRLVEGNVLIWVERGITYRLESSLPLAEVVRIAESLEPSLP